MSLQTPVIDISAVHFGWPGEPVLLRIEKLRIETGERVFLRGGSGSGKSTLLGLVAGIHPVKEGQLEVLGCDFTRMSAASRDDFRGGHIGTVFQQFNLVPCLDVVENVLLPLTFSRALRLSMGGAAVARPRALELLQRLGIDTQLHRRLPAELSVGQQQRVAVARALLGSPRLVLCDEPTSALDADNRDSFVRVLLAETEASGSAVLFVSHDADLAQHFHRSLDIEAFRATSRRMS